MTVGVLFDGDDTLWVTEPLYDEARWAAGAIVARCGLDAVKWEELERRHDVENVAFFGHSVERFPASCVQTYEEICRIEGREPDLVIARAIRHAAQRVFGRDAPVVPHARTILERLRASGVRLALLTTGDANVQTRRVEHSGLLDLFDLVEIVREKNSDVIQDVVGRLRVKPESAWLVGNSLRSDIIPAISAGLRAVWIEAHVWEYERSVNPPDDDRVIRASSIDMLPDLIGT